MRKPHGRSILLLVCLAAFAGCTDKKPDEGAGKQSSPAQEQPSKPEPAPQAAPPSTPDARPGAAKPSTDSEPSKPEVPPQRPKREPSPSPAAEPPTLVPETRKPDATPPREVTPAPKEEVKPAPAAPVAPQKPGAAEPKKLPAKDVVILTGSPLGGVRLAHKLHAERAGNSCATCHHASRPEKPASAPQQACSDCHTKVAAAPMTTKYQAAFHNPAAQSGTCIDCHKTESAKGKKAPLKCAECHKKENK